MQPNLHPNSRMEYAPTVPNHMAMANTARVGNQNMASQLQKYRVQINAASPGGVDYNGLNQALQGAIGGAAVTSHVQDNRQSLTAQQVSDIITRG